MKRIIRVLMIAAMIVSVERANAETNQPCSKSDTPIKCFEGSAGNGIYCSFPDGSTVSQLCGPESEDSNVCSPFCVMDYRPEIFRQVWTEENPINQNEGATDGR